MLPKILLIDDEVEILDILCDLLSETEAELERAESIEAAWEIIQDHPDRIGYIISDINMGEDKSGLDLRKMMFVHFPLV